MTSPDQTPPAAVGSAGETASGVTNVASTPPQSRVRSELSDGEWHRLHPLTPLLRGGLVMLVVIGIIISNLRDWLIGMFTPGGMEYDSPESEALDWMFEHNLVLVVILGVLGLLIVLVGLFALSWRFHTFRITGDDVEVRSGVVFRSHRRAPLDRVQGVNLTRPMVARLFGMAKLEVVGAGLDANVKLEYLSTANAETIRGDILRLASGRKLDEAAAKAEGEGGMPRVRAAAATVTAGLNGLIDGDEEDEGEPASVVRIPTGRVIAANLLSGSTIVLILLIIAAIVGSIFGEPWVLFTIVPAILGFGAYWFRQITRSLRYAIAPTSSGVRVTFGLLTTTTEVVPPGRVHAFEIAQPLLWRKFGWWRIRVNRISGRAATDTSSMQFSDVLPVGTREDVDRVMRLFLPGLPDSAWAEVFVHGLAQHPYSDDPFTTTPRRARWLRPLSWKRNGYRLAEATLLMRHGVFRRALVILPLARLQSLRIGQGPVDRALRVANLTGHTVLGPVSGVLGIIDRDDATHVWEQTARAVVSAAAMDRSHRWDEGDAGDGDDAESAPSAPASDPSEPVPDPGEPVLDPGEREER